MKLIAKSNNNIKILWLFLLCSKFLGFYVYSVQVIFCSKLAANFLLDYNSKVLQWGFILVLEFRYLPFPSLICPRHFRYLSQQNHRLKLRQPQQAYAKLHTHTAISAWRGTRMTNALLPVYADHLCSAHQFEGYHHFPFHQVTLATSPLLQQFEHKCSPISAQAHSERASAQLEVWVGIQDSKTIFLVAVLLCESDSTGTMRTQTENSSSNLILYIFSTSPAYGCRQASLVPTEEVTAPNDVK